MKKDNALITTASSSQILDIADSIGRQANKILSKSCLTGFQADQIIRSKGTLLKPKVETLIEELTRNLEKDAFIQKRKRLIKFFDEVFQIKLNLWDFVVPDVKNFQSLMFNPIGMLSDDGILNAYVKFNPLYLDIGTETIAEGKGQEQARPTEPYPFLYQNFTFVPVDEGLINKSLSDILFAGTSIMTISERLLCELFSLWDKNEVWDKSSLQGTITITSTSIKGSWDCMTVYHNDGRLKIRKTHMAYPAKEVGAREVLLF
jgi:hypothetical protein